MTAGSPHPVGVWFSDKGQCLPTVSPLAVSYHLPVHHLPVYLSSVYVSVCLLSIVDLSPIYLPSLILLMSAWSVRSSLKGHTPGTPA